MRDVIILGLVFATLPFCFVRPFFGILMWQLVSLLNPHRFSYGAAYTFPVAEAIAIPTLLGFVLFNHNYKALFTREIAIILCLWGWFTFTSYHNSQMPLFSDFAALTWYRWRFVSKILLMTLVTVAVVNTRERFRWYLLVTAAALGILVLKAVPFMILTGGSFRLYGPPGSMLADNNDFGLGLNMTLPVFFFLSTLETKPWLRLLLRFVFLATIPAVLFTYSRGAMLGLCFVLFLMMLRAPYKVFFVPAIASMVILVVLFAPEQWQRRMDLRRDGALIDDSALSRVNAWTYCYRLSQDYPLTGGGFEAFTQPLFDRYAPNARDVHGPHSIYFGVLAEHGYPGLACYLLLIGSCLFSLFRIRSQARILGDNALGTYALMVQFSLLAFLVSGAFLGRAYFDYYFSFVGCVPMLKLLARTEEEAVEDTVDLPEPQLA
jgi:putative inorganic carbon (HCO3(-)) transporter